MVAGAIALLVSGCGDGGGPPSPSPRRGAPDPAALVKVSGADLSIINRDRLLAGTRWQGRADSIGTWPLSEADRAELPSLRECAHGAEIGWAFRRTRPLGHTETDITLSPRDSVGVVELFAPLRSLGRGALEQGLRDGVTRCASKRHMRTRVMGPWHETVLDGWPASWRVCRSTEAWHAVLYQAQTPSTRGGDAPRLVRLIRRRVDASCAI
jgi:hypothetical protein